MSKENWLAQTVERLLPTATEPRSAQVRLKANVPYQGEALSPRALRKLLAELQGIVDPQVSEVEGGQRAGQLLKWHAAASVEERRDLWLLMSECFVADPQVLRDAQARYTAAIGTADEAAAQVRLRRETVSPRRRLLQRISAHGPGIRFLVDLRADLLRHLAGAPVPGSARPPKVVRENLGAAQRFLETDRRLQALDVEMEYLFSTWFDVGFLELRRIDWDSPASLIEKLIQYEAVHDIKGWADVKNRLDSDRRCYGFFHPSLPNEPLIFVEVALLDAIATSIAPLLDESADAVDIGRATTAIFYSISNTQTGLRGVSFGDSLIKRVVEALKAEFPKLRTFATLSPIPGLRAWMPKNLPAALERLDARSRAALGEALGVQAVTPQEVQAAFERPEALDEKSPVRRLLLQCAALYLRGLDAGGRPLDGVARFHLGNGARVESLDWAADGSAKGSKQSYGLMVNYLYDLKKLDRHRQQLARGKVAVSSAIDALAF